jgi:hypothetical protein
MASVFTARQPMGVVRRIDSVVQPRAETSRAVRHHGASGRRLSGRLAIAGLEQRLGVDEDEVIAVRDEVLVVAVRCRQCEQQCERAARAAVEPGELVGS